MRQCSLPLPFRPLSFRCFIPPQIAEGMRKAGAGGRIIFTFLPALLAFARGSDTHEARRFNCLPGVQRHSHQTSELGGRRATEARSLSR